MTDTTSDTNQGDDASISAKTERLDEIITQLEDGGVSLERAQRLHSEGRELLSKLEQELDLGEGEVIERGY